MTYQILIKRSAQRELDRLPAKQRHQVERRIAELGENPYPPDVTPLKGRK